MLGSIIDRIFEKEGQKEGKKGLLLKRRKRRMSGRSVPGQSTASAIYKQHKQNLSYSNYTNDRYYVYVTATFLNELMQQSYKYN